ncbi:MAG: hypothetical protein ACRD2B_09585 [Terriglobia bacterium]
MLSPVKILVALSDFEGQKSLAGALEGERLNVIFAPTLRDAKEVLGKQQVAVVFCQVELEDGNFRDILNSSERARAPVVVCAPAYDKEVCLDAMCQGAFDFIAFPYAKKEVDWILTCALPTAGPARSV